MDQRKKTRGFITLATGKEKYYQFAKNLLLSYKMYTSEPFPFAILCDQKNEYTELFDDVILLENAQRNYFDKFELLVRAPYDETIFIDSDCLAYADLNYFWEYFAGADDFSAGGINFPADSEDGLFWADSIGDYKDRVLWKPSVHGGLYYIRKGDTTEGIYREIQNIMAHYNEYKWPDDCVDEPVVGLAMAVWKCKAIPEEPDNYIIPWWTKSLDCDIFTGKCACVTMDDADVRQGRMIHWSVRYCRKPLYRFEAAKLNVMAKHQLQPMQGKQPLGLWEKLLYHYKLYLYVLEVRELIIRVTLKVGKVLGIYKGDYY